MSANKIITVFGATGNQGGSIVQKFLHDPKLKSEWSVRGVTRNAESDSAKKLVAQGVDMVSVRTPHSSLTSIKVVIWTNTNRPRS